MARVEASSRLNKILIRFNVNIEEYRRLTFSFQTFQFYETIQTRELALNMSVSSLVYIIQN